MCVPTDLPSKTDSDCAEIFDDIIKKAKNNLRALHVKGQSVLKKKCKMFSFNRNLF